MHHDKDMSEPAPQKALPLLRVRDLAVSFDAARGERVRAVRGVSMTIYPGQTLGVVGESGSGKSVTALSLMHLIPRPPGRIDGGSAELMEEGGARDLLGMSEREIRRIRGGAIAMIFQEPMTSLNPVFTIGDQIVEAIRLHRRVGTREARALAAKTLGDIGIGDAASRLDAYPHQFSGGMRQRVMIAMALACRPRLLLADEPTTALDATVQKQILELLREMKRGTGMAIMVITHDLGVVAEHADVVCVMYAGRVVEYGRTAEVLARPVHPYTRALLACVPRIGVKQERLATVAEMAAQPGFMRVPVGPGGPGEAGTLMEAWWPGHEEDDRYRLCQVGPERWVALAGESGPATCPPDIGGPRETLNETVPGPG
jgi:ABC-type dipeptide/oligopeptide/nickel transport system ATPase component